MPSIDSISLARSLARSFASCIRSRRPLAQWLRRFWLVAVLSATLTACGTFGPLGDGIEPAPEIAQRTEPDEAAIEPVPMPEAIATPDAAMPQPPSTQSARRLARRGQAVPAPTPGRDGPGTRTPEELAIVPDAVPRHEPLHPSANRPYTIFGRQYTPHTSRAPLTQSGTASWYGSYFHGRRTSTGEIYDMYAMSAAHPTIALPSYARVTNTATGKSVVVRINDRGPFVGDRIIDLSYAAATRLGFAGQGVAKVIVEALRTTPGVNDTLASSAAISTAAVAATAPATRVEPAAPRSAKPQGSAKVYVKIGAFRQRTNATRVGERIAKTLPAVQKALSITSRDDGIVLVQAGPYTDRSEAIVVADALRRELQIEPQIVVQ